MMFWFHIICIVLIQNKYYTYIYQLIYSGLETILFKGRLSSDAILPMMKEDWGVWVGIAKGGYTK